MPSNIEDGSYSELRSLEGLVCKMLRGLSEAHEKTVRDALRALPKILSQHQRRLYVGSLCVLVAKKLRPLLEDERELERSLAVRLFGELLPWVNIRHKAQMRDRILRHLVPFILHMRDWTATCLRMLQGLINDHKNAHGNAPVPPPPASLSRWRNPKLPAFHSQAAFGAGYGQQPSRDYPSGQPNATTWRKKYSLVNTPPRPALSSASSVSPGTSWATESRAGREAPEPQLMLSEAKAVSGTKANVGLPAGSVAGDAIGSGFPPGNPGSRKAPLSSRGSPSAGPWPVNADSRHHKETCASTLSHVPRCKSLATGGNNRPAAAQKKPVGGSDLTPRLGRTISESAITLKSEPRRCLASPEQGTGSLPTWKKPLPQISHLSGSHRQPSPAGTAKLLPTRSVGPSAGCAHSGEEASSSTGTSLPPNKPAGFSLQKSSSLLAPSKSSRFKRANYTWVANPSKSPRSAKRWAVSRTPESTPKFGACTATTSPKLQSRGAHLEPGVKPKRPSPHSKLAVSSSRYRWKAASAKSAPSTSASVFTWKRKEGVGPGEAPCVAASTSLQALRRVPLGHGSPRGFFGTSVFFNYRLRSWPKTPKRKGGASSPTLLLKSRYCLRKRHATRGRSSPTARKASPKGLVQISKHRLRRLPASRAPGSPKEDEIYRVAARLRFNRIALEAREVQVWK
ncbi:PREDICTED: zinc finger CCCH domain-containing protein 3 [Thamnophis sirtalis]|uniref:Zinc finger CCCH domain-containing protein 3 n=1 Tax=Thamnophis sirtalis TaxID=35019 RepID=A0A6I9YZR0_9SAUR|nr:PREDICTED: zinc finger CCCH domain-containing protein 3 [Thamnophis sirtalis]